GCAQTAARTQRALPPAREQQGKIGDQVTVAVLERTAEHDHRIIEKRRTGFIQALHSFEEVCQLLHMPIDDLAVLFLALRHLAVMRDRVESAVDALEK